MTLAEAQTERALVMATITSLLSGQISSYTVNGRAVTRLDLAKLWDRMDVLDSIIAQFSRGTFSVAQFRRPE